MKRDILIDAHIDGVVDPVGLIEGTSIVLIASDNARALSDTLKQGKRYNITISVMAEEVE